MKNIYKYDDFINEIYNFEESDLFYTLVESFYFSDLLTERERQILNFNPKTYLINENFFQKMKKGASDVIQNFSEKSGKILQKIIDASKNALDFIKNIKEQIVSSVSWAFNQGKEFVTNKLKASDKFKEKVQEVIKKDKNLLINEVKNCKNAIQFYKNKFKEDFIKKIVDAFVNIFKVSDNKEQIVNEGKLGIFSNVAHSLNNYPPFSYLLKFEQGAEVKINQVIEKLSTFTQKMGGPQIVIPTLAAILAIGLEYSLKTLVKTIISNFGFPFLTSIAYTLASIATFIAVVELIELSLKTSEEKAKSH